MVRVTPGVEAHTHEFIATAHEDQKFGLSMAGGDALEAVRRVARSGRALSLLGLHSHIGSQIFDTDGFEVAARRLLGLARTSRDEHGVDLPELDLGGGFGIAYTDAGRPATPDELAAEHAARSSTHECAALGLAVPRISIEPGRAIAGPGDVHALRRSAPSSRSSSTAAPPRRYVSVDGGMSDNIRTGALRRRLLVHAGLAGTSDAAPMLARVVGKHCESGDIVVRDVFLPDDVRPGDLLAVPAPGPTAGRWPATTTMCRGRRWSPCADGDGAGDHPPARPRTTCSARDLGGADDRRHAASKPKSGR